MTARLSAALADRYRIERELGAGGMATVYLAHDVRHDRQVALKVLRPELAAVIGGERFLAEIKTTANLQHPHILALFDSGQVDGTVFYVMPYVEGESLRDRLQREKLLPIDDALQIAKDVASALDYAHRHGVIHRDIKPENILLHDGSALVADFGIALAASRAEGGVRMTETGMSLGTPHYMSPEQAMGERTVDARTDQYALACVVYEMLTGEPPFTGATAQAIVAKVLTATPARPSTIRATLPPHVETAVMTALAKLPADRFRSVSEFAVALAHGGSTSGGTAIRDAWPARDPARPTVMRWAPWGIATVAVAGAIAMAARIAPRTVPLVTRSIIPLEFRAPIDIPQNEVGVPFDISSDGTFIVYVGRDPDTPGLTALWRRSLDRLEPTAIPGTRGGQAPHISPDGSRLLFLARARSGTDNETLVIVLNGGTVASTLPGITIAGWLSDGSVIRLRGGRFVRQSLSGVALPESLDINDTQLRTSARANGAPDGKRLVYSRRAQRLDRDSIFIWREGHPDPIPVAEGRSPRFIDDDHVAYVGPEGTLFVTRIDRGTSHPTSTPVAVAQGIAYAGDGGALYAIANDGTLVYASGGGAPLGRLVWVDRTGGVERPVAGSRPAAFGAAEIAPDDRHAAVSEGALTSQFGDIWIIDLVDGTRNRLTSDARNLRPSWFPDGTKVTYAALVDSGVAFVTRSVNGAARADTLFSARGASAGESRWSPDRSYLVYRSGPSTNRDISYRRADAMATGIPFAADQYQERTPHFSHDGRWLTYASDRTGQDEIYADAFPRGGERVPISIGGGREPVWSRDGTEIFYRSLDGFMMAARVDARAGLRVLSRAKLFATAPYAANQFLNMYDVATDGRFLMIKMEPQPDRTDVVLVGNWMTEVRARLGEKPR
jgi:serine/threonine-protein kinase